MLQEHVLTNTTWPPNLLILATSRFGPLTAAETKLLQAIPTGALAVCGTTGDLDDPSNDPAREEHWTSNRNVRGSIIRWICTDPAVRQLITINGIQLFGAQIVALDLSRVIAPFPLGFVRCRLIHVFNLVGAETIELDLAGSSTPGFLADGLTVKGNMFLRQGFRAEGEVRLVSAKISGTLDFTKAVLTNPGKIALHANGIATGGSVFLSDGFRAEGEVHLAHAQISGNLVCDNGAFINPAGIALNSNAMNVAGSMLLRNGFRVEGELNLVNARIGSTLECENGTLVNPRKIALRAYGLRTLGSVFFRNGLRAEGEVSLLGADIGGSLECNAGIFINPALASEPGTGTALNADRVHVNGYVFLRNNFKAEGRVNFLNAEIGGNFECDNSIFANPVQDGIPASGMALEADRANVSGYVFLRNGFRAEGAVNLLNAQIGSDLDCTNGSFSNPSPSGAQTHTIAIICDGTEIRGSAFLGEGFRAEGEVRLLGARIHGQLNCEGGTFDGGLTAQGTTAAAVIWRKISNPERATLDLINVKTRSFVDDRASWPNPGKLRIEGFTYERFSGSTTPRAAGDRVDWLARQRDFARQPYFQVARILRDEGDVAGSRRVLFEMERLQRKHECAMRTRLARVGPSIWSRVMQMAVGYGYYPQRCLAWLLLLTVLGATVFAFGYSRGSIVPTDKDAYNLFKASGSLPQHYEVFHPIIYSIENSFPFVKFGQADRWQPDPAQEAPKNSRIARIFSPTSLRLVRWAQVFLGWLLATLGVSAVTGIIRSS
jgi:hypothetical protein